MVTQDLIAGDQVRVQGVRLREGVTQAEGTGLDPSDAGQVMLNPPAHILIGLHRHGDDAPGSGRIGNTVSAQDPRAVPRQDLLNLGRSAVSSVDNYTQHVYLLWHVRTLPSYPDQAALCLCAEDPSRGAVFRKNRRGPWGSDPVTAARRTVRRLTVQSVPDIVHHAGHVLRHGSLKLQVLAR